MTNIAVVYYSSTGNVHGLAAALAEGASAAGAEVRLRRVAELASPEAMAWNQEWSAHHEWASGPDGVAEATLDDLEWADGIALGSPTRFGGPAAQLKQFLDTTGGLWAQGKLVDKAVTGFTAASTAHGGLESTILALLNVAYHWGAIVVPLGYGDPHLMSTGNPYGASWVGGGSSTPDDDAQQAARLQGARLVKIASRVSSE